MEFEKQKEEILKRAKEKNACLDEYKRALSAETTEELLIVVKDNLTWCVQNKMLDAKSLEDIFGTELLFKNHIYTSQNHEIRLETGSNSIYTLDSSQATVKTWGSSQATVETLDSSQATVETLDSSQATVKTWGSSQATVKTWDSSQATVKTLDSSQADTKVEGLKAMIRNLTDSTISFKENAYKIVIVE